jgi:hypothetical protein
MWIFPNCSVLFVNFFFNINRFSRKTHPALNDHSMVKFENTNAGFAQWVVMAKLFQEAC